MNKKMEWIYVCSPFSGDVTGNTAKAQACCKVVLEHGYAPFAPHLLFPQFLDDTNPEEREKGIQMGLDMLSRCKELWAFGDVISAGMKAEMEQAGKLGIPVCRKEMPMPEIKSGMRSFSVVLEKEL